VQQSGLIKNIAANCSAFLRDHVLTRENAWALLVALMLLLIHGAGHDGRPAALRLQRILMQTVGLIVAAAAVLALAVATWRRRTRPAIRAALAILAALGISLAASGMLLSALWLALDVVLIVITWTLARSGRMTGWIGATWIMVLILALLIAKLPPLQTITGAGACGSACLI